MSALEHDARDPQQASPVEVARATLLRIGGLLGAEVAAELEYAIRVLAQDQLARTLADLDV